MEWTLSQTRHWLVAPTALGHSHILQAGEIVDQRVYGWFGVSISLLVACRVPPLLKTLGCKGEGSM